jgi:hypothetical protein
MDYFLSHLFLREIKQQCEFAISDYNDIAVAISQRNVRRVVHSLQSFLIEVANISKILWPFSSKPKYAQRGLDLKSLLSIDDTSPLRTRDPRNIFEHFDEKLEDWYAESPHRNLMDMSMGYTDDIVKGPIDYIRYFNTTSYTFRFRGERHEINPLYEAVKELLAKVNTELSKPPTI